MNSIDRRKRLRLKLDEKKSVDACKKKKEFFAFCDLEIENKKLEICINIMSNFFF
jgi:hypothetical protein